MEFSRLTCFECGFVTYVGALSEKRKGTSELEVPMLKESQPYRSN